MHAISQRLPLTSLLHEVVAVDVPATVLPVLVELLTLLELFEVTDWLVVTELLAPAGPAL